MPEKVTSLQAKWSHTLIFGVGFYNSGNEIKESVSTTTFLDAHIAETYPEVARAHAIIYTFHKANDQIYARADVLAGTTESDSTDETVQHAKRARAAYAAQGIWVHQSEDVVHFRTPFGELKIEWTDGNGNGVIHLL